MTKKHKQARQIGVRRDHAQFLTSKMGPLPIQNIAFHQGGTWLRSFPDDAPPRSNARLSGPEAFGCKRFARLRPIIRMDKLYDIIGTS